MFVNAMFEDLTILQQMFQNACCKNKCELVDLLLLDESVDPSFNNNSAIRYASNYGYIAVVDRLLQEKKRVDPSADNNYAICWASNNGHIAVVDRLLQDVRGRVDPSAGDNSAIRLASYNGHIAVVDRL